MSLINIIHLLWRVTVTFYLQDVSVLQGGWNDAQHHRVLRHGAPRGGVHGAERQQDHVGDHPRAHGRRHVQAQQHEVQGRPSAAADNRSLSYSLPFSSSRHHLNCNINNNNTNICNARSVSKHTESEAQAVARWGGWQEWSVKCYLNRYVLRWRLKVGRVEQSLISRGMLFQILGARQLNDLLANSLETRVCCKRYWLAERKVHRGV